MAASWANNEPLCRSSNFWNFNLLCILSTIYDTAKKLLFSSSAFHNYLHRCGRVILERLRLPVLQEHFQNVWHQGNDLCSIYHLIDIQMIFLDILRSHLQPHSEDMWKYYFGNIMNIVLVGHFSCFVIIPSQLKSSHCGWTAENINTIVIFGGVESW